MPRTEHLSNIQPNKIYALDATVLFKHNTGRTTTAIIQQENSQAKIKIPSALSHNEETIQEGSNYHFGFCYIGKKGWISVRHPETSIRAIDHIQENLGPMLLSEIANNSVNLNGHYLTTQLYVVAVNPSQQIVKDGKSLKFCIVNCFANGYTVDVTLWNSDLPMHEMAGKWWTFSGFRLKKLVDWKFVLVSSVYSNLAPSEVAHQHSMPYNSSQKFFNLSSIFESRSILEVNKLGVESVKFFSCVEGLIKNIEVFEYEGCSECKKKLAESMQTCPCNENSKAMVYRILKITLADILNNELVASVFDSQAQQALKALTGPDVGKVNIKSLRKTVEGDQMCSHIVCKITLSKTA